MNIESYNWFVYFYFSSVFVIMLETAALISSAIIFVDVLFISSVVTSNGYDSQLVDAIETINKWVGLSVRPSVFIQRRESC